MSKDEGARPRAGGLAVGVLVVGLVAAVAVLAFGSDDRVPDRPSAAAPTVAVAPISAEDQPTEPEDGARFGWGSSQPHLRGAVVQGAASEPMTPDEKAALGEQLQTARDAALRIGTVREAERQGYVKNYQYIDGRGLEYINWDHFSPTLDLTRPTMLVFPDDDPDSRVISMAYNVLGSRDDGPPDDLPLEAIPWHYHSNLCRKGTSIVGSVAFGPDGRPYQDEQERCDRMGATVEPELDHWMVDLWVIPGWENPWGLVSSTHPDMYRQPHPWTEDQPSGGGHGH